MDMFFAHPDHSWERGTNENTNGLIRRLYPKKSSFAGIGLAEIKRIHAFLSDRPYLAVGGEYKLVSTGPWSFAGRAGFNSQTIGSIDGFAGVSFGIGAGYRGQKLDYGFLPLGGVGQAHRVSLTIDF